MMVPSIQRMLPRPVVVDVLDIGANPIDGEAPYKGLLAAGCARVVGFEPNVDALAKLLAPGGENEKYLPYALGDGTVRPFYICAASGMSSLLEPDAEALDLFHGMPEWGAVTRVDQVQTRRLDEVQEVGAVDFVKIDVQGAELEVLRHGMAKLAEAVVVAIEVTFMPLYKAQPMFGDVDVFLRERGFLFHRFAKLYSRTIRPMLLNNDIYAGLSQAVQADAVYCRDLRRFSQLSAEKLMKLAVILHEVYGSYDLAYRALLAFDATLAERYLKELTGSGT
jgi:FkbM family methyltransferase